MLNGTNGAPEALSHEDEVAALKLANEELGNTLVATALGAETLLRALTAIATQTGIPQKLLAVNLRQIESQVKADLTAGEFNPLKFAFIVDGLRAKITVHPNLILPSNGE